MPKNIADKYRELVIKRQTFIDNMSNNQEPDPAKDRKAYIEYKTEYSQVTKKIKYIDDIFKNEALPDETKLQILYAYQDKQLLEFSNGSINVSAEEQNRLNSNHRQANEQLIKNYRLQYSLNRNVQANPQQNSAVNQVGNAGNVSRRNQARGPKNT